ncbi:cobalt ABC transporter ATP-binding protein [Asanoa ishikariensis]|uniref:Biotin transport system ATP-binding protein n=1 Tax=Asanoa ishikariensis TaxID=137265 RepID=A0A1H3M3A4_9ACTN|nr:ABC transporter ATP-binding protein [Asanoa ishikariensis]GIF65883.1 cobalt ABC transporter ATP-binding protein [Asanoa ishikariensis]SDY71161.1 biotin transport system ATP-binding protein [Asanoa ishikariensis]
MTDIELSAVTVEFPGRTALRDVSVHLHQRRIAVIGSNGSGKSTFARTLNGLVTPTTGEVRVHGIDPVRQSRQLRRRVGFVFSNPDIQIIMPTVAEDAAFSLRGRGLSRAEVRERVAAALDRVGLSEYADSPAHSLSGGQKQLLALCAVLIGEPSLVVADEPTAYLDAANGRRIARFLLDEMPQQLVLATHDLRLAARCDIAVRFEDGQVVDQGDPAPVIARYEHDQDQT